MKKIPFYYILLNRKKFTLIRKNKVNDFLIKIGIRKIDEAYSICKTNIKGKFQYKPDKCDFKVFNDSILGEAFDPKKHSNE